MHEDDLGWVNIAAEDGEIEDLKEYLDLDPRLVNYEDAYGWRVRTVRNSTKDGLRYVFFAVPHTQRGPNLIISLNLSQSTRPSVGNSLK